MQIRSRNRPTSNAIPIFTQLINNVDPDLLENIKDDLPSKSDVKLFDGILANKYNNDHQACLDIYNQKTSKQYNASKARIRSILIEKIILTPYSQTSNSQFAKNFRRVNKEYAAFNILHRSSQNRSAAYLGELIVSSSIKYDLGDFIPPICSYLTEYYSIHDLDKKKVIYFNSLLNLYLQSTRLEHLSRIDYAQLMNLFVQEFEPGKKAYDLAKKLFEKHRNSLHKVPSIKFHLHVYLIKVFMYYSKKDFTKMDKAANEGYLYFSNLKTRRPQLETVFLRKSVEANLVLGELTYCSKQLDLLLQISKPGVRNWYNSLEIKITLELHQKKYAIAIKEFAKARNHFNFNNLLHTIKRRWGLLEAYINFLQLSGANAEDPTMSRYRINRFINETPQYSEDKKGRNIQLIIAQLLFYIIDKNWDKMEEKIDALQRYGTRYLKKNELFRSQVFIKMLLEIPRRMYHPAAIIRHTTKYRKRLEEMAPNIDLNGSTLEIIPYEDLWELIIKKIVPPKYSRKSALENSK